MFLDRAYLNRSSSDQTETAWRHETSFVSDRFCNGLGFEGRFTKLSFVGFLLCWVGGTLQKTSNHFSQASRGLESE